MDNVKAVDELFEAFSNNLTNASLNEISLLSQISANISIERIKRGLDQKGFAKYMNVSQKTVLNWEDGDYNFTIKELCEICEKLDLVPSLELRKSKEVAGKYARLMEASRQSRIILGIEEE